MAVSTADTATAQTGPRIGHEELNRSEGPLVDGFRDEMVAESLQEDAGEEEQSLKTRVFEQMGTFNRLVTGGVTLAVGILVYNEVIGALPSSSGAINQTAVTTTVESAFQLAPVALIVIVAAVILAQVMGFRS